MRQRRKFTASEDQFLRENYAQKTTEELSRKLGRSYQSIYNRCHLLGITPLKGSSDGRPLLWHGCDETCPERCPYNDCLKP